MSLIILNVDEVRRTLSASGGAFVVHDKEVDIVRFAINSGFADIVLDGQVALRVMYQRPGESEVRAQTLTYYDTDGLHNYYDWQLAQSDLAKNGSLMVALCILRTNGDVEEWHTTPCQIRVLDTIHTDDSDEADETITPTVAERVAVLETMIQRVASGAPIVVTSTSAMTDTEQIYVLSTNGNWYYHNGSAWVAGGEYGAVATDTTLSQSGIPADAKAVGDNIDNIIKIINNANLVSNAIINQNKGYGIQADVIGTLNNYSVVQFNVIGGISIHVTGLNENLTSYGYCIKNENGVTIQSGSESDDMTIKVPADGHVMIITVKSSNLSSLTIIPYLGESYEAIKEVGSKITAFFPQDATVGYYLLSSGNFSQRSGNYAYSDYIPVIPNAKYMIVGRISATTSNICHCFYDKNKNLIGSTLANVKYITTPSECEYVRLSLSSNNIDVFGIKFLEKKRNVVVFGDSWSDNDPEHTQYTKWTTLLNNSGDYAVKVYAQNGSTITGDTSSYGMNGNVQGQIEQFTSDELPTVDIVIFFGGINDFRGGKTVNDVVTKLTTFVNTVKSMYPDVNIVYIANHQLFITKEQLDYMHSIVDASRSIGIRGYTTFGWIPPTNFISDMVHPDDVGYKYIFANVESILNGGDLHYVRNYAQIDPTSESDDLGGHIIEAWDNGYPSFSSDLILYSGGVNKTFEWSITTSQKMLLSSLPFSKIYNKLNNVNANGACVIENTTPTSFTGNHKMNHNSLFRLITDASGRTGQWYTNDYN